MEVGKPGDFDHMADEELTAFIEAQGEVVRELERRLLSPPAHAGRHRSLIIVGAGDAHRRLARYWQVRFYYSTRIPFH
jgi:hypothetical protein